MPLSKLTAFILLPTAIAFASCGGSSDVNDGSGSPGGAGGLGESSGGAHSAAGTLSQGGEPSSQGGTQPNTGGTQPNTGGTQPNTGGTQPNGAAGNPELLGEAGRGGQAPDGAGGIGAAPPNGGAGGSSDAQTDAGGAAGSGPDEPPPCPKPQGQLCHEFIATDNSRNLASYVNEFTSVKPGAVEWSTSAGSTSVNSPRTIEIVANASATLGKAVLLSVNTGYIELDLSTGTKLANVTTAFTNVTGACRLPDGTTALGIEGNAAKIAIVNTNGTEARSFNLPVGATLLRGIKRDPTTGHFWLARTETIYELTDQGQVLWQATLGAGAKGYAVFPRVGGGAYASTGEPHTVVELNAAGTVVSSIGGDSTLALSLKLDFIAGFVRLANGNYVVANWLGHLGNPAQDTAEVIELQPDGGAGKAVWTWGNQTLARQITDVYVLR